MMAFSKNVQLFHMALGKNMTLSLACSFWYFQPHRCHLELLFRINFMTFIRTELILSYLNESKTIIFAQVHMYCILKIYTHKKRMYILAFRVLA